MATIASKVRLRLAEEQTIQPDPGMTLHPNVSIQMIVQRRDVVAPTPHPTLA
jgi:hypothetical protein